MEKFSLFQMIKAYISYGELGKPNLGIRNTFSSKEFERMHEIMLSKAGLDAQFFLKRDLTAEGTGLALAAPYARLGLAEIPFPILYREIGVTFADGFEYSVAIPNCSTLPEAVFVAESVGGSTVEPAFLTGYDANFRTLIAAVEVSKRILLHSDSGDPKELTRSNFLLDILQAALDWKKDYAIFNGDGVNEPTGLKNNSSLTTSISGASFSWETAKNVKKTSRNNKSKPNRFWVMHPNTAAELESRPRGAGSDRFIIEDNKLNGEMVSTSVQIGAADIFYGDFSSVKLLQFGYTGVTVPPPGTKGTIVIIPMELIDVLVTNPAGIIYISDFS